MLAVVVFVISMIPGRAVQVDHEETAPPLSPVRYLPPKDTPRPPARERVPIVIDGTDRSLEWYRHDETRRGISAFVTETVGSSEVAYRILYHAERLDISPLLAVSIAYVESRFDRYAINRNASSIDRGLFQLNSRTFPHLSEDDFFDLEVNARHAMNHFSWCLETTDAEEDAVAVYNAGLSRVAAGRTPPHTLVYVGRVMNYRAGLLDSLANRLVERYPDLVVDRTEVARARGRGSSS